MNITIADKNGGNALIIPIVPPKIPIVNPSKNQIFETLNGDLNIIGKSGLRECGWDSFFPNKKYTFAASGSSTNADDYVSLINRTKLNKEPLKIVITGKNKHTVLNVLASIEKWEYAYDNVGDVVYSIGFKEYVQQL